MAKSQAGASTSKLFQPMSFMLLAILAERGMPYDDTLLIVYACLKKKLKGDRD